MLLRPCTSCRRHVREHEACPFCGAAGGPARPSARLSGRLSRAAVFAGAALAGCSSASPRPAPPPGDDHVVVATPADAAVAQPSDAAPMQVATPIDAGGFAQPPPPPDAGTVANVGTATIAGTIRSSDKSPFAYETVTLNGPNGLVRNAQTDESGRYAFTKLPAGTYKLSAEAMPDNPRINRPGPTVKVVKLVDKQVARVDLIVESPFEPVDNGPCCKPYGAPPARRRVV